MNPIVDNAAIAPAYEVKDSPGAGIVVLTLSRYVDTTIAVMKPFAMARPVGRRHSFFNYH